MMEHHDPMCADPTKCKCFASEGHLLQAYQPSVVSINSSGGMMVAIKQDGTVTFGPNYTPDEAARLFWTHLASWPCTQAKNATLDEAAAAVMALSRDWHGEGGYFAYKRASDTVLALKGKK